MIGVLALSVLTLGRAATLVDTSRTALQAAIDARDLSAIQKEVAKRLAALGPRAGRPEIEPSTRKLLKADPLSNSEVILLLDTVRRQSNRNEAWRSTPEPRTMQFALSDIASIVTGYTALRQFDAQRSPNWRRDAEIAMNFLISAQKSGETGVFPFPNSASAPGRRAYSLAAESGRSNSTVRNNWIIDDGGSGELHFEHATGGIAACRFYATYGSGEAKSAATRAYSWSLNRRILTRAQANAAIAHQLVEYGEVSEDPQALTSAAEVVKFGIVPFQLTSGSRAGWWLEQEDAVPKQHCRILRAIARTLPHADIADAARLRLALIAGVQAERTVVLDRGTAAASDLIELLEAIHRLDDASLWTESGAAQIWSALEGHLAAETRRQQLTITPSAAAAWMKLRSRRASS